jgi:hypothetical protein
MNNAILFTEPRTRFLTSEGTTDIITKSHGKTRQKSYSNQIPRTSYSQERAKNHLTSNQNNPNKNHRTQILNLQMQLRLPERSEQLNLWAAVHHHLEAGLLGKAGGGMVNHANLPPQHFGADGDRFLGDAV